MMVTNLNNYHLKLYIFLGLSVGAMSTATFVIIRSMVSKIVSRSEVGSIFSLISSLDSLIPILIAPGLTELYKVTIDFFPGTNTQVAEFHQSLTLSSMDRFHLSGPGLHFPADRNKFCHRECDSQER